VEYTYLDFAEDLRNLKAFLALRDTDPVFAQVRAEGKIGIPCILQEDGTVSLDWTMYVSQA
jgi:glutaredoxin-related protein